MDINVFQLAGTSWLGQVRVATKPWFNIYSDSETRAFETCAEFVLQRGFLNISGRLPSLMLDNDQLIDPEDAHAAVA